MLRYERKYRIEQVSLTVVEQVIRNHPASLIKLYPDRQINNIYFDTNGLTTYHDNVMGIAYRKKYRVRWYGYEPTVVKDPILEIKVRQNEVGTKLYYPVDIFDFSNLDGVTKQVNRYVFPNQIQPVLQNSYRRSYYGTRDGKFRLTLDWDLSYASLRHRQRFQKHHFQQKNVFVLELKYAQELEQESSRITQYLPFRRTKNSKYVSGIEWCY